MTRRRAFPDPRLLVSFVGASAFASCGHAVALAQGSDVPGADKSVDTR
jgi:hypothetical protein